MQNFRTVFNPFSANKKYALPNRGNLLEHFQIRLSQKQKIFSFFFLCFFHFLNLDSILNISKKEMTLIGDVF